MRFYPATDWPRISSPNTYSTFVLTIQISRRVLDGLMKLHNCCLRQSSHLFSISFAGGWLRNTLHFIQSHVVFSSDAQRYQIHLAAPTKKRQRRRTLFGFCVQCAKLSLLFCLVRANSRLALRCFLCTPFPSILSNLSLLRILFMSNYAFDLLRFTHN